MRIAGVWSRWSGQSRAHSQNTVPPRPSGMPNHASGGCEPGWIGGLGAAWAASGPRGNDTMQAIGRRGKPPSAVCGKVAGQWAWPDCGSRM
jgi:hypothetical protein